MTIPDYDTLDNIADAYIPLLAAIAAVVALAPLVRLQWSLLRLRVTTLAVFLTIAYALMFVDNHFRIWPQFGLDYSTHTAVALVLIVFLTLNGPRPAVLWWVSLTAYVLLMLYQRYHTFADILVTAVVVGMATVLSLACIHRWRSFVKLLLSNNGEPSCKNSD